jgi:VWFA-related protein
MRHQLGVLAAALLAAGVSAAQQPRPTFRTAVEIVHLDVSVLDSNRRPVRGLRPEDFTILQDGQPQSIAVFQAVDIPALEPPSTAWIRDVAPDVRSNRETRDRRLFLLILDDATIQTPRGVMHVKGIARQVIDGLGPSDLAAIVFTRDNRNAQDFTADRGRLLAAVEKYTIGFRDMGLFDAERGSLVSGGDDGYFMFSANVLESAIDLLSTMPDRRKAIIYVGQGIPVDLDNLGFSAPGLPAGGGVSEVAASGLNARLKTQMDRVFQHARRANVNVYTLDACGLRVTGERNGKVPVCTPGLEQMFLRTVAENTGGRAVVDTNDFSPGVGAIFEENASYYLLGFQPGGQRFDGSVRRLAVRVNQPGVTVRTRSSYQAETQKDARRRQAAAVESPLRVALSGILPRSDLPLHMSAVPFAVPGRKEAAVAMVIGVRQPLRASATPVVETVDLQVSAFSVEGRHVASKQLRAEVGVRPSATGLAEYEVLSRLDLKPGRYQLRIAAHLGSLLTSGSLYYDVVVPDFADASLSLSGLVLSASPGFEVAPKEALQAVVPVVPTARRTFAPSDTVHAFVRVYQGGRKPLVPVPLRVYVLDAEGSPVMNTRQDLPVAHFSSDRAANVLVPVPVDRLARGEYLLVVETIERIRRETRFTITR